MDRLSKTNLRLEFIAAETLIEKLQVHDPQAMLRHAAILKPISAAPCARAS